MSWSSPGPAGPISEGTEVELLSLPVPVWVNHAHSGVGVGLLIVWGSCRSGLLADPAGQAGPPVVAAVSRGSGGASSRTAARPLGAAGGDGAVRVAARRSGSVGVLHQHRVIRCTPGWFVVRIFRDVAVRCAPIVGAHRRPEAGCPILKPDCGAGVGAAVAPPRSPRPWRGHCVGWLEVPPPAV